MVDKIKETSYYHTRIRDWPENERPREKLILHGPASLSDAELLAIFIRTGSGEVTAVDIAKKLLIDFNGLHDLSIRSLGELRRMKGIGAAKGTTLLAAFELAKRINRGEPIHKKKIRGACDVFRYYGPVLKDLKKEVFNIILLDSQNQVIIEKTISEGSLDASIVHPREVFKEAITESASALLLIHNHPSGNSNPSNEDRQITKSLVGAGKLMGIAVYDHIIIGDTYYSFAEHGEIDKNN